MRLPVGDTFYDRLQNLVSAFNVTVRARMVGDFWDVAAPTTQQFL